MDTSFTLTIDFAAPSEELQGVATAALLERLDIDSSFGWAVAVLVP